MRQLFLIEIHRCALSCFVLADIGDIGQPPGRRFVQMLEAGKCAAVEQVLHQVPEWAFDFALRFRPAGPAGHGSEAIVGGEGQEACVVNGLLSVVAADNDLHVVVETIGGDAAQMREGRNVLANRRGEVLTLDEIHILAAGVSKDIAEGVNAALALRREVDLVGGIIHLRLNTWSGFKAPNELAWLVAYVAEVILDNRIGALESEPTEFFPHADGGDLGITFQKLKDVVLEWV